SVTAPLGRCKAFCATSGTRSSSASTTMRRTRTRIRCGSQRSDDNGGADQGFSPVAARAAEAHRDQGLAAGTCSGAFRVSDRSRAMKLYEHKERLEVGKSDLSGSVFDDVNMSGCTLHNINLSGASIDDANMSGWRVNSVNLS